MFTVSLLPSPSKLPGGGGGGSSQRKAMVTPGVTSVSSDLTRADENPWEAMGAGAGGSTEGRGENARDIPAQGQI